MGSSSNSASREAQAAEDKRRADILATQQRIQEIFGSPEREGQIQDFIGSTRDFLQGDLDRDKLRNDRELKFALARGGLSGGSSDVDQNQNLSEAFLRASVEGERRAQSAGSRLRDIDQSSKFSLFNQALSGLDLTTAAQNAGASLRNNISLARNEGSESNFDSFFSDVTPFFKASREAAGRRRQQREFGTLFGARPVVANRVAGGNFGGFE